MNAGDTVALVTPAGPVAPELLDRATAALEGWGLTVKRFATAGNRHPAFRYLADTDEQRAADFQTAWLDPAVSAVISARGGYGTQRMLDLLDWDALRAAGPKLFTGSSDVTALHQAIAAHLGWATVFSPMPGGTLWDDVSAAHLHRVLFDPGSPVVVRAPEALVPGSAEGVTTGGNLSLLASSVGTPEHRPVELAIAILEDVTEHAYRLDRMLTQLLRSGWFARVTGIVLGSWTGCGNLEVVRSVMLDRLAPLGVPILWEAGFGHLPGSVTIPLGVPATIDGLTMTCAHGG
ncbi:LD-carboxypeptidase [Amycolatopsis acidiphila]|uniref:LD-carboxypeptidase n=1 Tax=Amycolatopsis acidiphila TaxID=715473 RepID=A0A558AAU2_9PSEU|nr:LD-carboxypeptidase [Amycolatopsis acidiphila]TVT21367.1 LD-carboxypeptidase [Amycolatopsis acidiphila]UIJ63587.1 LD-carboxypeptidase [Amycolatopsis acidiphila]GHG68088.1 muramoyltetrapeptide carboxypeptidase [Amycolatopsis acidiphila]